MTFEQTMHTLESHLEALQADYDRLLEENSELKEQLKAISDNSTMKPAAINPYYAFKTYMETWQLNPRKKYDVKVKKGNAFIYYLYSSLEPVEYESSGGGRMVEFKFTSPFHKEPILVSSGSNHLYCIRESNT